MFYANIHQKTKSSQAVVGLCKSHPEVTPQKVTSTNKQRHAVGSFEVITPHSWDCLEQGELLWSQILLNARPHYLREAAKLYSTLWRESRMSHKHVLTGVTVYLKSTKIKVLACWYMAADKDQNMWSHFIYIWLKFQVLFVMLWGKKRAVEIMGCINVVFNGLTIVNSLILLPC